MEKVCQLLALCLFLLLSLPVALGQTISADCPMLQDDQLGNTSALSPEGLLPQALMAESGDADPLSILILETNTVCLGQGTVRDTYRSVSVIVSYMESNSTEVTVQVEYQCVNGSWDMPSVTQDPMGDLTTALRTDCALCNVSGPASAEEHCIRKAMYKSLSRG